MRWLTDFGAALERSDVAAAVDLFADECYWRDLLTFTWSPNVVVADLGTAQFLDTSDDGSHPVSVEVCDAVECDTANATVTVLNAPPTIRLTGPDRAEAGQSVEITVALAHPSSASKT